jgi:hypothetical protein
MASDTDVETSGKHCGKSTLPVRLSSTDSAQLRPQIRLTTRVKGRRSRRASTPRHQFVTATDPIDCRNEQAKRKVRSQAMTSFRERKRRLLMVQEKSKAAGACLSNASVPAASHDEVAYVACEDTPPARALPVHQLDFRHFCPAGGQDHGSPYATEWYNARLHRVLAYQQEKGDQETVTRVLSKGLSRYHQVGDDADSSHALPRFQNPELSAWDLTRTCK